MLAEQDDVENFVRAESFAPELWQLSDNKDGTYTAKKYKGQFSHAILPEMIGKYKVAGVRDIGRKYDIGFLRSLTLSAGITSIRICFENMPQLERIEVSEDNPRYSSRDGILFNKAGDTLLRCPCGWKGKGMYIVPEKVKKIEGYAFAECDNLTEIRLPEGLETIELCTFYCCRNLSRVVIPNSVQKIETYALGSNQLVTTSSNSWMAIVNPVTSLRG